MIILKSKHEKIIRDLEVKIKHLERISDKRLKQIFSLEDSLTNEININEKLLNVYDNSGIIVIIIHNIFIYKTITLHLRYALFCFLFWHSFSLHLHNFSSYLLLSDNSNA